MLLLQFVGVVTERSRFERVPCRCACRGPACCTAQDASPARPHLVLLQGGPPRPVGMHSVDACLTHLAVAGRDSVVRLYSFE